MDYLWIYFSNTNHIEYMWIFVDDDDDDDDDERFSSWRYKKRTERKNIVNFVISHDDWK